MRKPPDRDVEALLRSAAFSNPVHKDALRQRLFGDEAELEPDDLALVAGGLTEPIDDHAGAEPFRLIPALMQAADIGETKTQTRR